MKMRLAVEEISINRKGVICYKLYRHKDINTQLRITKLYVLKNYALLGENASNTVKTTSQIWS